MRACAIRCSSRGSLYKEVFLDGLEAAAAALEGEAVGALLKRLEDPAVQLDPDEWNKWRNVPESALRQLPAPALPEEERLSLHELLGRLRELRLTEAPLAAPALGLIDYLVSVGLIDYLVIVCSPRVAPLRQALVEAHTVAALVEGAGMSALVLHDGLLFTVKRAMMLCRPRVVVFVGHANVKSVNGQRTTLGLVDSTGQLLDMRHETMVEVLASSDRLELLVLNGCCSEDVCTEVSRRFGVATAGWRTLTADVAAKVWSIGLVERLVRDAGPLSRSNVLAAFEHGRRSVEVVANRSGRSQWAIADSAEGKQLPGGAWAAGVPMLLAPLPPDLLDGVPPIPEQYEPRPALEAEHRAALLRSEGVMAITAATTGISGPAGAGKSTMAIVLARDPLVHAHFPDGVTWLSFGRERTGADVLRTLATFILCLDAALPHEGNCRARSAPRSSGSGGCSCLTTSGPRSSGGPSPRSRRRAGSSASW